MLLYTLVDIPNQRPCNQSGSTTKPKSKWKWRSDPACTGKPLFYSGEHIRTHSSGSVRSHVPSSLSLGLGHYGISRQRRLELMELRRRIQRKMLERKIKCSFEKRQPICIWEGQAIPSVCEVHVCGLSLLRSSIETEISRGHRSHHTMCR